MASNNTNDFYVQLMAALDPTSVNKEFDALKKKLAKDPVIQKVTLDTSMSKQAIKDMATEIHNELGKAFKETGIESFDITVKDVESILSSAVKESNKLAKELDTASSKAQKFLAQFNNKSGGTLVNSKEFKAVQDAISGLGKTHSIDDLNKAMNTLETTYNNMVSSLRNSGKSLNPFINAKNEMATMDDTIKGIGLEFEKLANKPKSVSDAIKQLSVQQANVNSFTVGTQEWADAYGKLQQMIQKVKSEISNLQKAQSAKVAVQIFDPAELDKQGRIYVKKINNTIEKTKSEIESKLRNDKKNRWTDIQITGVEKANGQIKSLTVQATNAAGAFKELRFEAQKIATNSKKGYQTGLVQTSEVKTLKGNMSQMRQTVQTTLDGLKSKWQEQGVLVGDFKTKVEQLQTSLASVGSKGELNNLKSQMESLKTQASQIAEVDKIQLSMSTGGYESKVDSLIGKTQQWVDANGNARISTDALQTAMNNLNTAYANISATGGNTVANQQALVEAERALDVEVKKVQSSVTSMNATMAKSTAVDSLRQKVQMFYDTNTKSHRTYGAQLRAIMSELASGAEVPITKLRQLSQEFIGIQNSARQAGKLGLSFFDTMKQGMSKFSYWTSSTFIIMKTVQEVKNMINNVKELDDALINISYTMDVSDSQLKKIGESALQTAKDLNTSASNVLDAVKTYANATETAESILNKAKPTIMMSNVTGMGTEQTVDIIQGTIEQFDLEDTEEQLMHISDVLQTVSMSMPYDFSKGVKELSEGIQASGSVAKDAGYDLENYTALLGTLIAKTRQSGSELGRSLRTMFVRTTKASSSALANGEVTEDDLSNAEKALRRVGIEVRSDVNTFKDFDEIMGELYNKVDSLSEVDLSNIAYEVASTRQTNVFKMMIKAYGDYQDMAEKAYDADGATITNQEKYAESLKGKLTELSTIWDKIGDEAISSDFLKGLTDVGIGISSLIEKFGLLNTAIAGIGIYAGVKNAG